ncbi:hypothetical protein M9Y10_040626 [Tritrichomonas musculus]|uniref:Uncharacterized protein n=1 Tax=Tritrichomonas musculus TaxID=1915356 RepID=A0ABR2GQ58_9EUKA
MFLIFFPFLILSKEEKDLNLVDILVARKMIKEELEIDEKRANELEILISKNKSALKWGNIHRYQIIQDTINRFEMELVILEEKIRKKKETLKKLKYYENEI